MRIVPILLMVIWSCGTPSQKETTDHIETNEETEKQYYALPGLDHGLLQSPINVKTGLAEESHHSLSVDYHEGMGTLIHKAHTIEVDFPEGNKLILDSVEYGFKQFHFHTPSEHQLDGITYPMEMHMVHTLEGDSSNNPYYLVMAVLFKEGEESTFINDFLGAIPEEANTINPEKRFVSVRDLLLHENLAEYYCYLGSLTTPPYTESVKWYILKEIHQASEKQIQKINELEGDNARHVQALYGRKIEE